METLLNLTSLQAFHFATYEAVMLWLNPEKSYNPYHHALAGAVAGGVAATAALPLDACKTLLNTQEVAPAQYTCICVLYNAPVPKPSSLHLDSIIFQVNVLKQLNVGSVIGLRGAASTIYRMAGVRGFYQGLRARIFFVMPGTAISWWVPFHLTNEIAPDVSSYLYLFQVYI